MKGGFDVRILFNRRNWLKILLSVWLKWCRRFLHWSKLLSNGFGSLACSKDAAVVVPAVAAVELTPSSLCILSLRVHTLPIHVAPIPAVRYDLNGGLPRCIRFIIYQEYMVIVYWCVLVNLILYLYLFWLNKHCLSLNLNIVGLFRRSKSLRYKTITVVCV